MTRQEQLMIDIVMFDTHFAMDTAANLLQITMDDYFISGKVYEDFASDYERIQTCLEAVREFLHQACLRMDFITGEETTLTEAYKRSSAELIAYHNIQNTQKTS